MSFDAAQQHARLKAEERSARVTERRAELLRLCNRLPAGAGQWSAQRTAAFKQTAADGRRAAGMSNATEQALQAHINALMQFYS